MNKKILIKNLPEEKRPREKLLKKGANSLSNEELLAIVLGSGIRDTFAKGLAERIICQSSVGLRFLTECVPEKLTAAKHGILYARPSQPREIIVNLTQHFKH